MSTCCVFLLHSSLLNRIVRLFYLFLQGFELAHHGSVNDAVFSPSEGRVATAGGDALVKVSGCWLCLGGFCCVFSDRFWTVAIKAQVFNCHVYYFYRFTFTCRFLACAAVGPA